MKKIAHIAGSLALVLSFNVGTVTTASANNIQDFCRDAVDNGVFETMGKCQSAINKGNLDFCKDNFEALGFKNQGQCVKWIRGLLNDYKKA